MFFEFSGLVCVNRVNSKVENGRVTGQITCGITNKRYFYDLNSAELFRKNIEIN